LSLGFASHPEPTLDTLEFLPVGSIISSIPLALFGHCGSRSFGLCPAESSAVDDSQCFRKTSYLFRGVRGFMAFKKNEIIN